ncbi:protein STRICTOSIDINE SYNTHASE-LIKE 10-like [Nicotiana tabacum]|uniref:Protein STRICTOSIDINE SYNTHASE-LIKE 10-like n=2 Tax=Nicotiana TaxID=4085 RepID=A0A1S4B880_TOBAC|nr:PREDICTED: strictosidine synthase 1-like [Nicotiana sylvestris]XP_016485079.1 PREDICTED: protein STRICTOSIDINE SYNTHASE-LIKE 10-like [Nicotiana tabacum]
MNASKLLLSATTALTLISVILAFNSENMLKQPPIPSTQNLLRKAEIIQLKGAVGPESIAFDPNGEGPYTGVADGRILKWQEQAQTWANFAVTSSERNNCTRPSAPEMEHICGRPLGLRFDKKTGDLYIADAYFGLQVVGPKGGLATPLVHEFEGKPLIFTNDMDIDDQNNVIYFTDSSTKYQRRQYFAAFVSGDTTGRLMKYDKSTKKVTVLLRGLAFANGVALNKDQSFLLVSETANCRIIRYWIKGPYKGRHDIFADVPGFPDNIRINSRGEFWVALNAKTSATAIKLSAEGQMLEVLEDEEGKTLRYISQVEEKHGKLWFGSVTMPFLGVYGLS